MNRKKRGFVFISVMMMTILITSITLTVTILNSAHARDVFNDRSRNKAYYLANMGLELAYAAINEKTPSFGTGSGTGISIMEASQIGNPHDFTGNQKDFILDKNESKRNIISMNSNTDGFRPISITTGVPAGTDPIIGYIKITGDMFSTDDDIYFRVVCTSRLSDSDSESLPSDTHTLTMFVFKSDPNNPKIYNGDKQQPN